MSTFTQQVAIREVYKCLKRYQSLYGTESTVRIFKDSLSGISKERESLRKPLTDTQRIEIHLAKVERREVERREVERREVERREVERREVEREFPVQSQPSSRCDSVEHLRVCLEEEFGSEAVLTLHRYLTLAETSVGELELMKHSKEKLLSGVALLMLSEGSASRQR
jgi:hypothetical protein